MGKRTRVCFIATEMAGIGAYGGFGVLTRDIACAVAARGLDVFVVMPRKPDQRPVMTIDGVTVVSFPGPLYTGLRGAMPYAGIFKAIDADVYHSEEPSVSTRIAQLAEPRKKHIVTVQDPRTIEDWRKQWVPKVPSRWAEMKFLFRYQREVGRAAREADACYCQAKYIIDKSVNIFRLRQKPGFLPNPVAMPDVKISKALDPTVCFVGRWDEIKRPELFLDLAKRFPKVKFILAGASANNPERDRLIRSQCATLPNVEAPGWINSEQRSDLLSRSWVMINTSTKECLPVTYLEAGAHECAILSHGNADEFASNFGYWAERGDIEDFSQGLQTLLQDDSWRAKGKQGREYVLNNHEFTRVIDQHIRAYDEVLSK